jgi:hypothetical protein
VLARFFVRLAFLLAYSFLCLLACLIACSILCLLLVRCLLVSLFARLFALLLVLLGFARFCLIVCLFACEFACLIDLFRFAPLSQMHCITTFMARDSPQVTKLWPKMQLQGKRQERQLSMTIVASQFNSI